MSGMLRAAATTIDAERATTRLADYFALTKPGITGMSAATTLAGFLLGSGGVVDAGLLLRTLLGTALLGGGSSALNMFLEREADARMERTRNRPLPAGRLLPVEAFGFGLLLSVAGVLVLAFGANLLTGALGATAVLLYALLYTPLKRRTSLCTAAGAVVGAIPPVLGWTAARGELGFGAWALFGILFLWQLPHFLALAWIWREDYERGGFPMLPVLDRDGAAVGRQVVLQSLALLVVSLAPAAGGLASGVYFWAAAALGLGFLAFGIAFALSRTESRARRLFQASLAYLPALLAAAVVAQRAGEGF